MADRRSPTTSSRSLRLHLASDGFSIGCWKQEDSTTEDPESTEESLEEDPFSPELLINFNVQRLADGIERSKLSLCELCTLCGDAIHVRQMVSAHGVPSVRLVVR